MCIRENLISYKIQFSLESQSITLTWISATWRGSRHLRHSPATTGWTRHWGISLSVAFWAQSKGHIIDLLTLVRCLCAELVGRKSSFARGKAIGLFFLLTEYTSWINKSKVKFKAPILAILLNVSRHGNVLADFFSFLSFFLPLFFFSF